LNASFAENIDTWNTLGGGDYDGSVVSSGTLPAWASAPPCTASIDLTSVLRGNLDKVRDNGILMMIQGEGSGANSYQNFASKEELPPSTGAYLEIDYTAATGITPDMPLSNLLQNHPNPFNPHTTIQYSLAADARISIDVYSVSGKLIRRLLDERKNAGSYRIHWDGRDRQGQAVSSGIYFCSLRTRDYTETRKMVLLR
ncbi:MAG: FlgD immunoglobulin-like domain containing protein, partial [Candidatus Krumholzibacteria bacterium]|nr:FlgD immunoglobulin-like domain containing protein [Candidatus Krumholzibacteria bacterium]